MLDFARPYLDPQHLKAWLADRDLRDPWQEGNNIVNLGSFLLLLRAEEPEAAARALDILMGWHDYHREPASGFFGVGQFTDAIAAFNAFAGSMHAFHLWYATHRPLPAQERAVDYVLSCPTGIASACIDVDLVDLLVHAHERTPWRRGDIEAWLRAKLDGILDFINPDGGFPDERAGIAPPGRLGPRLCRAAGPVQHILDMVPLDRHRHDRRPAVAGPLALALPAHGGHRLPGTAGMTADPYAHLHDEGYADAFADTLGAADMVAMGGRRRISLAGTWHLTQTCSTRACASNGTGCPPTIPPHGRRRATTTRAAPPRPRCPRAGTC